MLMRVGLAVSDVGVVCPPDSKLKYSCVFYVFLCSCIILCYFTGIFYAVVIQISVIHRQ